MGICCGKPEDRYETSGASNSHNKNAGGKGKQQPQQNVPHFGLSTQFEVIKLLGTGGEGETWLCKDRETSKEVAIKLVRRPIPKPITQIIQREIKILADLGDGHLNIVHAEEVILTRTHVGLVMEYVSGGNMVAYVTKRRATKDSRGGLCIDEDEANYFFRQLIYAVQFCHQHHVAHRDLKLDNTILDSRDPPRLKLCDFGFAKGWGTDSNMDTMRIGTPEYMGPELISGRVGYDGKKVDVWASGVLLFVMLLGMFPFEMEDENYVNTAGMYSIWLKQLRTTWQENPDNASVVARLSKECRDLMDKIFDTNQDSRISIEGIMAHPWFNKKLPTKYENALASLRADQAALDRSFVQSVSDAKKRDQELMTLLEKATQAPQPCEDIMRVLLTRVTRTAMPPLKDDPLAGGPGQLAAISEGSMSMRGTQDLPSPRE